MRLIAKTIKETINDVNLRNEIGHIEVNNEEFAFEGKVIFKLHKYRERDQNIVKNKKKQAMQKGILRCEICGFDFFEFYGEIGNTPS